MSKVLIIRNISREGPGLLAQLLQETTIPYVEIDVSRGETIPDPTNFAAVVVLGGPASANDQSQLMLSELKQVKRALDAEVPYLGICLGLQVAVKAAGGSVVKSPVKEVGLMAATGEPYSVSLTEWAVTAEGKKDPLFVGLPNEFRVFQLHGETVELTDDMRLLATGRDCRNQIVKLRSNAYGIQSHFELTRSMLIDWLRVDPDLTPLGEETVLRQFKEIESEYTLTGRTLLRNFLHIAQLL